MFPLTQMQYICATELLFYGALFELWSTRQIGVWMRGMEVARILGNHSMPCMHVGMSAKGGSVDRKVGDSVVCNADDSPSALRVRSYLSGMS